MQIVNYSTDLAKQWDDLVKGSPDGFVYALSSWRDVILAVERWALVDHSFAVSDGVRLLGVMPLQYNIKAKLMSSSGWGGSGPVVASGLGKKHRDKVITVLLEHAQELAQQCGAKELFFNVPSVTETSIQAPWGVNPWLKYGFEDRSGTSRVIDLQQEESQLWRGLSETSRHAINKAKAEGYYVERANWLDELEQYYQLHVETYTRTGVPPHPRTYFSKIAEKTAVQGNSILWVCKDVEGVAVAYHNSAVFGNAGAYHTGCSSATAHTGAGYLLFWEALRGLKEIGVRWYECGEVFPGVEQGQNKLFGLTTFKSKFGGDDHRSFKCVKFFTATNNDLETEDRNVAATSKKEAVKGILKSGKVLVGTFAGENAAEHLSLVLLAPWGLFKKLCSKAKHEKSPSDKSSSTGMDNRQIFIKSELYRPEIIANTLPDENEELYARRLLREKFSLLRKYLQKGPLLDICCGNGAHLAGVKHEGSKIGLDYSMNNLTYGKEKFAGDGAIFFVRADATILPFAEKSVQTAYCFSACYSLHNHKRFYEDVFRILTPGGVAVLDLGNKRSLNSFCCKYYPEFASHTCTTIEKSLAQCRKAGFEIVEHRCFQLLPLWAGRPKWLWPLLHPKWNDIMKKQIKGKMLDEWVSSLPLLRKLAFRHLVVCRKPGKSQCACNSN